MPHIGAPPISVFSGDRDVHLGYDFDFDPRPFGLGPLRRSRRQLYEEHLRTLRFVFFVDSRVADVCGGAACLTCCMEQMQCCGRRRALVRIYGGLELWKSTFCWLLCCPQRESGIWMTATFATQDTSPNRHILETLSGAWAASHSSHEMQVILAVI